MSDKPPTFHYIECQDVTGASNFDPDICIMIQFNNGDKKNAILFGINDIDQIYKGYILDTLDPITLTGDWDGSFSDSSAYLITVSSELLPSQKRFQRSRNGITSYVQYNQEVDKINDNIDNNSNLALESGQPNQNSLPNNAKLHPIPSSGWNLKLFVYYDDSMFRHYGEDDRKARSFVRKVVEQTETFFDQTYSFPTTMKLDTIGIRHANGNSWKADQDNVEAIAKEEDLFKVESQVYVFLCMPEDDDTSYGIVPEGGIGYVCNEDKTKRMTIIENKSNNEITASVVLAHEIGHLFGVSHDYNSRFYDENRGVEWPILSKKFHRCRNKGGIMDRIDPTKKFTDHRWTACSRSDLQLFYNRVISTKTFCVENLPADEIQKHTKPGKQVRLPCSHKCEKKLIVGVIWRKQTTSQNYDILKYNRLIRKTEYIKKNKDKIDKDNIFINPRISDTDIIIDSVEAADAGSYICHVKSFESRCEETRIVNLNVETGKKTVSHKHSSNLCNSKNPY